MIQEFQIARAKHVELEAQYNSAKLAEGMTVEVLSAFDRAVLAVRDALLNFILARLHTQPPTPTPSGAVAR